MSLLSLLGWKSRRYECCEEAHDALRYANATSVALRRKISDERSRHIAEILSLHTRIVDLLNERERARDVAGTFLCCDGIDHGEPT